MFEVLYCCGISFQAIIPRVWASVRTVTTFAWPIQQYRACAKPLAPGCSPSALLVPKGFSIAVKIPQGPPLCTADEHVDGLATHTNGNIQHTYPRLRYVYGMFMYFVCFFFVRGDKAVALVCSVMLRRNPARFPAGQSLRPERCERQKNAFTCTSSCSGYSNRYAFSVQDPYMDCHQTNRGALASETWSAAACS